MDFKYQKVKGVYDDLKKRFRQSSQFKHMLITNFINLLHPPPFFEYQIIMVTLHYPVRYSISTVLSNLLFLRFYLLIRFLVTNSSWESVESEEICEEEGFHPNFIFSIKALMKQRPFLSILINFAISTITFGFAVRSFERGFYEDQEYVNIPPGTVEPRPYQNYNYVWNSFWLIVVTMSTVGYGDFYPITHFGRLVVVIASFWGMIMVSQFIYTMEIQSNFSPAQAKAYELLQRLQKRNDLRQDAALLIQSWWQYYQSRLNPEYRRNTSEASTLNNSFRRATVFNYSQLNDVYLKRVETFKKSRRYVEKKGVPLEDSLGKTNSIIQEHI